MSKSNDGYITIKGAKEHNLKNIDLEIPRNKLVVFTGVSGSGKSSLAFDTIYAEGRRRYVESLSAYARQFLGQVEKPQVDFIGGLSPSIAIEQKSASKNPRSTVGTITEIYDYMRVLYARIGIPHCHKCGREVGSQTSEQIIDQIMELPVGTKFMVLAPVVESRKGEFKDVFESAQRDGFVRVRINGIIHDLQEDIILDKKLKYKIEIVVDRLVMKKDIITRLTDSVETALKIGIGSLVVSIIDGEDKIYSTKNACVHCGISFSTLSPQSFSFNSPIGMCPKCDGLGKKMEFAPERIVPDPAKSIDQGAIAPLRSAFNPDNNSGYANYVRSLIYKVAKTLSIDLDAPWENLTSQQKNALIYGYSGQGWHFEGAIPMVQRWWDNSTSEDFRHYCIEHYISNKPCPECNGGRLKNESLAVIVSDKHINEIAQMTLAQAYNWFANLKLDKRQSEISREILKEIVSRIKFLLDVGLHYLTLERSAPTLSGGEAQRIRLASQVGSGLVGVLYVLDEPSIGLHQRDNKRFRDTLFNLKNIGNTVIVVEHDENTIRSADYIVDFGPSAGIDGGYIVANGSLNTIIKNKKSITGKYLSGELSIPIPQKRRAGNGRFLSIKGTRHNNLKNINVDFPLGTFICITGVSGSGKSSLVNDILYKALARNLHNAHLLPGAHDNIKGIEYIDKVIDISQEPIGRTPRSNPATYTKVFDPIRNLFAMLPEAKIRGYKPGRFSFNVQGGRCEACEGDGVKVIEMHFLPDVYITCDVCNGCRFNRETLKVTYKGHNIANVLDMSVSEAREIFKDIPSIEKILSTLIDVGLGYIKLGQPATTLSGGEAQRVKLSKELRKKDTGKTVYILDEPTTGLHFADVQKLLIVLDRLVEIGNTIIVIEHNLDVIKTADYIIDLGPEGGDEGGYIVETGTPEKISTSQKSHTGRFLLPILNNRSINISRVKDKRAKK